MTRTAGTGGLCGISGPSDLQLFACLVLLAGSPDRMAGRVRRDSLGQNFRSAAGDGQ
jgi:hypothetical protein